MGVFRNNASIVRAQEMRKRLAQDAFREAMKLSPEQMDALDAIAAGKPPRNAMAILKAIELKCEYAYEKPKTKVDVEGNLNVSVEINLGTPGDK